MDYSHPRKEPISPVPCSAHPAKRPAPSIRFAETQETPRRHQTNWPGEALRASPASSFRTAAISPEDEYPPSQLLFDTGAGHTMPATRLGHYRVVRRCVHSFALRPEEISERGVAWRRPPARAIRFHTPTEAKQFLPPKAPSCD